MVVRIYSLSPHVANQIAAGEVIERPASVVKELLENALDAGADTIHVDIGFGGLNHIKISDNGIGILADDLPLAIAPHATSKISQLHDLYAIRSMGFRGEALASIASVSRLTVSSKPASQAHGMMLRVTEGATHLEPCARSQGTTLDVRDLFFNVPVRKKFLKSQLSEYQAIEAVIKRFALSTPNITLTLNHNDKQTLSLPAARCEQTTLLRIKKVLGRGFLDQAIHLDVERAGMRLSGWVSGLKYQRSQNDKQWIYVNHRMVKDKLLNHALKQSYEGMLHSGRHPACLLYLTLPPQDIDVNVHPTKYEVRFQQPRLVHDFITSHIKKALSLPEASDCVMSPLVSKSHSSALSEPCQSYTYPVTSSKRGQWLVLNTQFVVIFVQNTPYLLDYDCLQHHLSASTVKTLTYPMLSRPLLLPVSYLIDQSNYSKFEAVLPLLSDLGLQCEFVSESRLRIRTLPQAFPLLDIQRFLDAIPTVQASQPELLKLLLASQSFDAYQVTEEEQEGLIAFLNQAPDVFRLCCRVLSTLTCRGFFHG
jgi:DNA mismatch repair protein MutL